MASQGHRVSLQSKLHVGLVLLFIPLLVLAGFYYTHLRQVVDGELREQLLSDTRAFEQNFVTPHLSEQIHQFNVLFEALKPETFQRITDGADSQQDWQLLSDMRGDVQILYFGNRDEQWLSYPAVTPGEEYRPTQRPWYQIALDNLGSATWSEPYPNYGSDDLVITLSRALLDEQGQVVGVLGMDTLLGQLSAGMTSFGESHGGWQALINQSGRFVANSDADKLWQSLPQSQWQERFAEADDGIFYDLPNGVFVSWRNLDILDWTLVSVMPANELQEALRSVSQYVTWIISLSVLLYLALAATFSVKLKSVLNDLLSYLRLAWQSPNQAPLTQQYPEVQQLYQEIFQASQGYHEASRRADRDQLTGAYNRSYFENQLERQVAEKTPFCLGLFDLDNFKVLNDTFGHPVGDAVLKRVAAMCEETLGNKGVLIRYGGEEFVVIIYTDLAEASRLFSVMRLAIEQLVWRERGLVTTFSGGLVAWRGQSRKALLRDADKLVYKAKREGKNRICVEADADRLTA